MGGTVCFPNEHALFWHRERRDWLEAKGRAVYKGVEWTELCLMSVHSLPCAYCVLCAWLLNPHWEINGVFVSWNWYSTIRNMLVSATVSFHSDTQNMTAKQTFFKEWTNTFRVFVACLQSNMESLCIVLHWIAHRALRCYCVHFMGILQIIYNK